MKQGHGTSARVKQTLTGGRGRGKRGDKCSTAACRSRGAEPVPSPAQPRSVQDARLPRRPTDLTDGDPRHWADQRLYHGPQTVGDGRESLRRPSSSTSGAKGPPPPARTHRACQLFISRACGLSSKGTSRSSCEGVVPNPDSPSEGPALLLKHRRPSTSPGRTMGYRLSRKCH